MCQNEEYSTNLKSMERLTLRKKQQQKNDDDDEDETEDEEEEKTVANITSVVDFWCDKGMA